MVKPCLRWGTFLSVPLVAQRGCGVSSFEISRSHLDVGLGTMLWVSLLDQGLGQMDPEGPASLSHAVILWFCDLCAPVPESICKAATEPKSCRKDMMVRRPEGIMARKLFLPHLPCCAEFCMRCEEFLGFCGFLEFDLSKEGPKLCWVQFFIEKHRNVRCNASYACTSVSMDWCTVSKLGKPVIRSEKVNSSDI